MPQDTTTTVPDGPEGLPTASRSFERDDAPADRSSRTLIDDAAEGLELSEQDKGTLLDYFVANGELPGDSKPIAKQVTFGDGAEARTETWQFKRITWDEWQEAREKGTDSKTGLYDSYIGASWVVARSLVHPRLGPTVLALQRGNRQNPPEDAPHLLRQMLRKQSGVLLQLSATVLEMSDLQGDRVVVKDADAEVAAGKG